jgi:hypothetical protein
MFDYPLLPDSSVPWHVPFPEIPKSQRNANRTTLAKVYTEKIIRDKQKRDKKIAKAVEKQLYSQRDIAD